MCALLGSWCERRSGGGPAPLPPRFSSGSNDILLPTRTAAGLGPRKQHGLKVGKGRLCWRRRQLRALRPIRWGLWRRTGTRRAAQGGGTRGWRLKSAALHQSSVGRALRRLRGLAESSSRLRITAREFLPQSSPTTIFVRRSKNNTRSLSQCHPAPENQVSGAPCAASSYRRSFAQPRGRAL